MAGPLLPDFPGSPNHKATSSIRWGDPVARKVFSRSRMTFRTSIACSYDDYPTETESKLEWLTFLMLRLRNDVGECRAQPFELKIERDGGFRYTPDFLVFFLNREPLAVECKKARDLADETLRRRLTRVARALERHDMEFCVVTEKQIPREISESNLVLLSRALTLNSPDRKSLPSLLYAETSMTFARFVREVGAELAIAHIAFGDVTTDLSKPITNSTLIYMEARYDSPRIPGWYPLQNEWDDFQD